MVLMAGFEAGPPNGLGLAVNHPGAGEMSQFKQLSFS
jgi:hypothetical protein